MHCYLTQPLLCTVGLLNVVLPLNWGKKCAFFYQHLLHLSLPASSDDSAISICKISCAHPTQT